MRLISQALMTAFFAAVALAGANAQSWPDKPVRMIVLSGPGGSPDVAARAIANELSRSLGKQFIVENRVSAGGIIGLSALKSSAPDGYSFVLGMASAFVTSPKLTKDMPYDVDKDFEHVAFVGRTPIVVAVRKDSPLKTFGDLVKVAREAREPIAIATTPINSLPHLLTVFTAEKAQAKILAVPFSSSPQGIAAVLGGEVVAMVDGAPSFEGMVRSGDLRLLASFSEKRLPTNAALPLVAEETSGVAASGWFGLVARTGTRPEVIEKLRSAVNAAVSTPEVEAKLASLVIFPDPMTGPGYAEFLDREKTFWAAAIDAAGAKPE
jgi:tripartite-type tricarboxylate transporter receptor subunit TctC